MSRKSDATPKNLVGEDRLLRDPALVEALADPTGFERLSDADIRAMRTRRRQAWGTTGAVALAIVIGLGERWNVRPTSVAPVTSHFATQRGQRVVVQLADGSSVTLDGATTLDVTLADDRRIVALQRGEAYFDVAHDPKRPFIVHAGGSSARVLGTAFDLNLTRAQVELDVYRGAVRFGQTAPGVAGAVVRAGYRSRFAKGLATTPTRFDPTLQGWREGWLDAEDMPLADLVEAINRQDGTPVLAPPAALADIKVAGRFRVGDPASLMGAIGGVYGFRVVKKPDGLHLEAEPAS